MSLYVIKMKTGALEEIEADNYAIKDDGWLFFYDYDNVIEQGVASFSKDSWDTVILRKKY